MSFHDGNSLELSGEYPSPVSVSQAESARGLSGLTRRRSESDRLRLSIHFDKS